jgi:O-antigen/teichoic acid export membrane protein
MSVTQHSRETPCDAAPATGSGPGSGRCARPWLRRVAALWQFLNGHEGAFRERVLRSGAWQALGAIGARSAILARTVVVARLLTPQAFGLMGLAQFILEGFDACTQLGHSSALVYRREHLAQAYDTAWVMAIVRGLFLAGLVVLAAPYVATFYQQPALRPMIQVIALGLAVQGLSNVYLVEYQRDLDFKCLALFRQAVSLLDFVVVVTLAWRLRSAWALIIGSVASNAAKCGLSFAVQRRWPRPRFRLNVARELCSYGKFVTGASMVTFLATQLDNAIVGKLLGMEALGFYVLAYSLANMPYNYVTFVVSKVMFPSYSAIQREPERLRAVFLKVLEATAALTIPGAVLLAVLGSHIVGVVYGEKWLPMVGALQILCLQGLLRSLAAAAAPLFLATGRPQYDFYLNLLRLLVMLVAIVPLTLSWGIRGAAVSVCLAMAVACVPAVIFTWRTLAPSPSSLLAALGRPAAAALVMAAVLFAAASRVQEPGVTALLSEVLAGGGACLLSLALLNRRRVSRLLAKYSATP